MSTNKSVGDGKSDSHTELPKLLKGTSFNFAGSISRNVLNFVYVVVLTRFLNAAEVGIYLLAINVIIFISIFSLVGVNEGIRRFVSIAHGNKDVQGMWDILATSLTVAVLISLFFCSALFFLSDVVAAAIFSKPQLAPVLKILSFFLVLYAFTEVFLSTTQAFKQMRYRMICFDMANNIFKILFATVFFYMGMKVLGAALGFLLAMFVTACLSFYYVKQIFPPRKNIHIHFKFKKLLSFSIPVVFAQFANSSSGMIDTILLGSLSIAQNVGIYNIALKVALLGGIVLSSFNMMFAPMISELHSKEKRNALHGLYSSITKWVFTLSLPIFLFLMVYSKQVLFLFGPEFVAGQACLIIICFGQIVNASTGPSGIMLLMSGHPYLNLTINVFSLVLLIILNLILIPLYGIVGCAEAVAASIVLANIIRVVMVHCYFGMNPYNFTYMKPLFSSILCIITIKIFTNVINVKQDLWFLAITVFLFLLLYFSILKLLKLDDSDQFVFNKIKNKVSLIFR